MARKADRGHCAILQDISHNVNQNC